MKTSLRKLTLSRETIRALQDTELFAVRGGQAGEIHLNPGNRRPVWNIQPGDAQMMPCPSSLTHGGGGFDLVELVGGFSGRG